MYGIWMVCFDIFIDNNRTYSSLITIPILQPDRIQAPLKVPRRGSCEKTNLVRVPSGQARIRRLIRSIRARSLSVGLEPYLIRDHPHTSIRMIKPAVCAGIIEKQKDCMCIFVKSNIVRNI
jgi:hypothetical protein